MLASDIRGADYRAKAQQALAHADASTLLEVRRRHQAAASAWFELATFEDRRSAHARERMANAPVRAVPAVGLQPAEPFPCQS
ncbi:hypothetical protein [Phenylobacterium sp.]|jgi:hypothetical protein|uniref:hypothetical protein n=1 Tax=Phenylobacterium sp. TaxID=1871053 RepID=UPI003784EFC2